MDPVKKIYDATGIALEVQNALGFAMPPIIPIQHHPLVLKVGKNGIENQPVTVKTGQNRDGDAELAQRLNAGLTQHLMFQSPVSLGIDGYAMYRLQLDPEMHVSGKNKIVRRTVNKSSHGGTIKERWTQDDWTITISGKIIGSSPEDMMRQCTSIRDLCINSKNGLRIQNDFLNNYLKVFRIAVEDFDFPFTKGTENQHFSIKGFSDDVYDLLIANN